MGSVVKKVAPIALPALGMMITGVGPVVGGLVGGALGGVVAGGGLKGALIGGALGGFSGGIVKAGGFGNFFGGLGGTAAGGITQSGGAMAGILGRSGVGTMTQAGLASGALGSSAVGARLGTLSSNFATSGKPQSFLGSKLAAQGSYRVQPGILDSAKTLGKDVIGYTTTDGIRTQQMGERLVASPSQTGLSFDRESLKDMVTAGFSGYRDDLQQKQLDALRGNLGQYRSEYGEFYASEAKKHQEKLARGELPETYNAALDREAERLKRLLVAQGHNPAESGYGRDQFKRGLMDLESKFIDQERDYWRAVGGGADTMTAQIGLLESNLAQSNIGTRGSTQALDTIMDKIL